MLKSFVFGLWLSCLMIGAVQAQTDCSRPVSNVWNEQNTPTADAIWVYFDDGGQPVFFKATNAKTERQLDRMFSIVITALTTHRLIRVRYPEVGGNCAELIQTPRGDIWGVWLTNTPAG